MTKEGIEQLARLARLRLSAEEAEHYAHDFDSILGYVDAVSEIAAEERAPIVGPVANVLRDDVETHEPGVFTEAVLSAAPERKGQYVQVKKILDQKKDG